MHLVHTAAGYPPSAVRAAAAGLASGRATVRMEWMVVAAAAAAVVLAAAEDAAADVLPVERVCVGWRGWP